MASTVSTFDHTRQLIREFGLDGYTLKLALVSSSYTYDSTDTQWADISANEITGTGYTSGGETCSGVTVAADGDVDMSDVQWTTATITFRAGVLYISGTVDGKTNPPLFYYLYDDTPADISVTASNFTHVVAAAGVF